MSFIPKNFIKGHHVEDTSDGNDDGAFLFIGQDNDDDLHFFSEENFPDQVCMLAEIKGSFCDASRCHIFYSEDKNVSYDFYAQQGEKNKFFLENLHVSLLREIKSLSNNSELIISKDMNYTIDISSFLEKGFKCQDGNLTASKEDYWDAGGGFCRDHEYLEDLLNARQRRCKLGIHHFNNMLDVEYAVEGSSIRDDIEKGGLTLCVSFKKDPMPYYSFGVQITKNGLYIFFKKDTQSMQQVEEEVKGGD
jgi:hypothetical protein